MPDMKLPERDPTLVAVAYKKQRLYLFTRREPADAEDATVRRVVMTGL
jgi:peptidylprolyl isomerase domain and WD repeat-containing protein 1